MTSTNLKSYLQIIEGVACKFSVRDDAPGHLGRIISVDDTAVVFANALGTVSMHPDVAKFQLKPLTTAEVMQLAAYQKITDNAVKAKETTARKEKKTCYYMWWSRKKKYIDLMAHNYGMLLKQVTTEFKSIQSKMEHSTGGTIYYYIISYVDTTLKEAVFFIDDDANITTVGHVIGDKWKELFKDYVASDINTVEPDYVPSTALVDDILNPNPKKG